MINKGNPFREPFGAPFFSRKMRRKNKISKALAYHEAGHAVAMWYVGHIFYEIIVRTDEEYEKGPYVDQLGRERWVIGTVEASGIYIFTGVHIDDVRFINMSMEDIALQKNRKKFNMEVELITQLAGPIAEAKYRHCGLDKVYYSSADERKIIERINKEQNRNLSCPGATDYDNALLMASEFSYCEEDISDFILVATKRVRAIFKKPGIWPAVEALAKELEMKKKIDGERAEEIIQRISGNKDRPPPYYTVDFQFNNLA